MGQMKKSNSEVVQIPTMEDLGFLTDEQEIINELLPRVEPKEEWYQEADFYLEPA